MKCPVVHIIYSIDIGGAEGQLLQLARLQTRNRKVTIVYFTGHETLKEDFEKVGVRVLKLPSKLRQKIRVLNEFADSGTIIHTHLPHAELFSLMFIRNSKKFITTRHVAGKYSRRLPEFIGMMLLNLIVFRFKQIITISEVVKKDIERKTFSLFSKKLHVIHYGFPFDNAVEELNPILATKHSRPVVIGTISRLEKQKNIEALLIAVERLEIEVELKIVGDGTLRKHLIDCVRNLELQDKVSFLGKTRKVAEFLDSIDIFVLASRYEGFGIVLVEAAARNTPIVASSLPICKEVLGESGALFFDPKNPRSITEKLEEAISLLPMTDFRTKAKSHILKFDLETLISKTDKIYGRFENL